MRHKKKNRQKVYGYTLLEVMVALTVFAIIGTLTTSVMYYAFDTRNRLSAQADVLDTLQIAMTLIEHDTLQMTHRFVRTTEKKRIAFVGSEHYLEFTRNGLVNPNARQKRSTLQRVAYICDENQLIRRTWPALDSVNRSSYQEKTLLTHLTECKFAFLNTKREVLQDWQSTSNQTNSGLLPIAVQMTLTLNHQESMSLLFIIPEALYG